jgi:hypothetical protein
MSNKMWGGRFASGPDAIMEEINASIGFDYRFASQDIRGSLAHVAMLARSRGVPMIVGLGDGILGAAGQAIVEADSGLVVVDPDQATATAFETRWTADAALLADATAIAGRPARTADGTRIGVWLNIAEPAELDGLDPAICDGIGDLNADCIVNGNDLAQLLGAWGPCASPCPADLDGNGAVDGADLAFLLARWG